jgi:hypothetical protein
VTHFELSQHLARIHIGGNRLLLRQKIKKASQRRASTSDCGVRETSRSWYSQHFADSNGRRELENAMPRYRRLFPIRRIQPHLMLAGISVKVAAVAAEMFLEISLLHTPSCSPLKTSQRIRQQAARNADRTVTLSIGETYWSAQSTRRKIRAPPLTAL